ncbi:MAG: dihydrolipoyl dehydrogenase family protein [Anaerolineae bacterium]
MSDRYHMIVIGGGAAGLTAAAFAGELGAKVALIEKAHLGGDCTWVGCVPSKALLKVAKVAHEMRVADTYGITSVTPQVDMTQVKAYVKHAIHEVYEGETPEVFAGRGVEVIEGTAQFIDAHTITVNGRQLQSKNFVIATGARPLILPIEGLDSIDYHTNETFFDNERLPEHLVVLGAGAIGMEMAQAYARLGAQVTVIGADVMPRDDTDAVTVIKDVFAREGVTIIEDFVEKVEKHDDTRFTAMTKSGERVSGDMMLVAVGRAPTVEGLGLAQAGVEYDKSGIPVDKYLRTNVPHIYAVGDVTTGPKLTHYAGFQGSIAGRNIMFPLVNFNGHTDLFPWTTFTDPEVAQIGMTERDARAKLGDQVKVYTLPLTEGDRSQAEGDTEGFIKIVYKGSGDLLGVTVVAARAGEMIQEYANAMTNGGGLRSIMNVIHAYPTYSDIVKKAASKLTVQELFAGATGKAINLAKRVLWS